MGQKEIDLGTSKWICKCGGDCVFEFAVSRKKAGVPIRPATILEYIEEIGLLAVDGKECYS